MVVGLITDYDETAYREVRDLAVWCQDNNLSLNVSQTIAVIVDYRKQRSEHGSGASSSSVSTSVKIDCIMVHTNQPSREEGTLLLPQGAEKIWHGPSDP